MLLPHRTARDSLTLRMPLQRCQGKIPKSSQPTQEYSSPDFTPPTPQAQRHRRERAGRKARQGAGRGARVCRGPIPGGKARQGMGCRARVCSSPFPGGNAGPEESRAGQVNDALLQKLRIELGPRWPSPQQHGHPGICPHSADSKRKDALGLRSPQCVSLGTQAYVQESHLAPANDSQTSRTQPPVNLPSQAP